MFIKLALVSLLFNSYVALAATTSYLGPQPNPSSSTEFVSKSSEKKSKPSDLRNQKLENGVKIAIIVNKDLVTLQDIQDRAMLILLTSGMPRNDSKILESVKEQVKYVLIDEKIQLQAAAAQKVIVSEGEIKEGIKNISKDNNMNPEEMIRIFKESGVPLKTLEDRLRAQIAWAKTIREAFGQIIHISDQEVEDRLKKIISNKDKLQYELLEIFLRIENPSDEERVRKEIKKIYQELKAGAHFRSIAQQFSQSISSSKGGYIGWMVKGQIDPVIETVIDQLQIGDFSPPIRTAMGYKIILLQDIKKPGEAAFGDTQITYREVHIPYNDTMDAEQLQIAEEHYHELETIKSCHLLAEKARALGYKCNLPQTSNHNELPEGYQRLFHKAPINQCVKPGRVGDELLLCMICKRDIPSIKMPTAIDVRNMLEQEKLSKIALREFNKIKSVAFIEDKTNTEVPSTSAGERAE